MPAAILHDVVGDSKPGHDLQVAIGDLHCSVQCVRWQLRDPEADGDFIQPAVEAILDRAKPPDGDQAATACLLCSAVGSCLSAEFPGTNACRLLVTGPLPMVAAALKRVLCTARRGQANLLAAMPDLPLAQAFLIVELWVSTLLGDRHCMQDDVLVSPQLLTGSNLRILLTSYPDSAVAAYSDSAVAATGRVGVFVSSRQIDLHEANKVPLPRVRDTRCFDP